jgi:hypothetical protein
MTAEARAKAFLRVIRRARRLRADAHDVALATTRVAFHDVPRAVFDLLEGDAAEMTGGGADRAPYWCKEVLGSGVFTNEPPVPTEHGRGECATCHRDFPLVRIEGARLLPSHKFPMMPRQKCEGSLSRNYRETQPPASPAPASDASPGVSARRDGEIVTEAPARGGFVHAFPEPKGGDEL